MKRLSLIGAAVVGLAAVGLAFAADSTDRPARPPGPPPCGGILRLLDADTNGELSAAEIANASAALLNMDSNGDGALTKDELMPAPPACAQGGPGAGMGRGPGPRGGQGGGGILRHDTDGDGTVTLEEFTTDVNKMFTTLDANGDSVIDADEAQAQPALNGKAKAKTGRRNRGR